MEVDGAMLLSMAFSPRALEDDPQWRDVPDVPRSAALQGGGHEDPSTQDPNGTCIHRIRRIQSLQDEMQQLKTQVQDVQRQADARHEKSRRKLSSLWGEVAATARAAADAQTQQLAAANRVAASWQAAETQLKLLQRRVDEQEQDRHELRRWQETCSQQLRRMQRDFEAHDHRVVGTTGPAQKAAEEVTEQLEGEIQERFRSGPRKHGGARQVLLHQRYVKALKRQQQRDRAGLSTVVEDCVSV
ncbi:hypothetical protein PR003_g10463 [Phytophthora rubi]|uniref:Uncharacterized protein n=2 Tax=Phytophthora rubi TaxID=129364 RepID=A0A6A3MBY2_9STRA|nr:hypothetical protein PR002_g10245 [Phytophthora rubi]KAE9340501.1 hypothetical protein PR003_g10463 [Phytophthora rubi]